MYLLHKRGLFLLRPLYHPALPRKCRTRLRHAGYFHGFLNPVFPVGVLRCKAGCGSGRWHSQDCPGHFPAPGLQNTAPASGHNGHHRPSVSPAWPPHHPGTRPLVHCPLYRGRRDNTHHPQSAPALIPSYSGTPSTHSPARSALRSDNTARFLPYGHPARYSNSGADKTRTGSGKYNLLPPDAPPLHSGSGLSPFHICKFRNPHGHCVPGSHGILPGNGSDTAFPVLLPCRTPYNSKMNPTFLEMPAPLLHRNTLLAVRSPLVCLSHNAGS